LLIFLRPTSFGIKHFLIGTNGKIKETNPFVQLLWDKGTQYEKKVITEIGEFLDLSKGDFNYRFEKTIEAMKNKTPLIYQGVLIVDNLRGVPDLLRLMPDGKYIPIDIKSGMGFKGVDEENGDITLRVSNSCIGRPIF